MKDKSSLRKYYLELLIKQGSDERLRKSKLIAQKLFGLDAMQHASTVLFYASLPGEVDTFAMIAEAFRSGKKVALPIVEVNQRKLIPTLITSMEDVHNGTLGIPQPQFDANRIAASEHIDVVVVPGLSFDKAGNRLGRGAGYYDRFLSTLPKTAVTVGLAFDFQLADRLPVEGHDVPLQHIISN